MWDKRLISYCSGGRRGKAEVCVKLPCCWEEIMPRIFMADTHNIRFSHWLNVGADLGPVPVSTCEPPAHLRQVLLCCLQCPGTMSILLSRKLFWGKLFSRNYVQVAKELTKTRLRPARFNTTYTKKAPRTSNQWLMWAIHI